jgi:hypothetical protein
MPGRHESPLIANFWKLKRAWPLLNNFLSARSKSKSPTLFSARSSKQASRFEHWPFSLDESGFPSAVNNTFLSFRVRDKSAYVLFRLNA